jgi:hypothetical protein
MLAAAAAPLFRLIMVAFIEAVNNTAVNILTFVFTRASFLLGSPVPEGVFGPPVLEGVVAHSDGKLEMRPLGDEAQFGEEQSIASTGGTPSPSEEGKTASLEQPWHPFDPDEEEDQPMAAVQDKEEEAPNQMDKDPEHGPTGPIHCSIFHKVIIDNGATELSSKHIKSMLCNTSDIVLQHAPHLVDWHGDGPDNWSWKQSGQQKGQLG